MVTAEMGSTRVGRFVNRVADRALTPLAAKMAKSRIMGNLSLKTSYGAGLAADFVGFKSWKMGSSLDAAASLQGLGGYHELMLQYSRLGSSFLPGGLQPESGAYLERAHIIANHKLVSFHAAFISSLLSLPDDVSGKMETLKFVFLSAETAISTAILYLSWHAGIAIHEMGHYLAAAKLTALNKASQQTADSIKSAPFLKKLGWYAEMFVKIPWGKFDGVKNQGGNYSPDAAYNLAVAAEGPRWSGYLAMISLPIAAVTIGLGLAMHNEALAYIGRFFLAPGCVGLLDRFLADRGKLHEFSTREATAAERARQAAEAQSGGDSLLDLIKHVRDTLISTRMMTVKLEDGSTVSAPWQWRNSGMGGRHTEAEYPESNISMQEAMFMPLSARNIENAQEMTLKLQTRLKQIIEAAPGARVMGIGLEGGLAPYIDKEEGDKVPEQRLWRMMKQAILDCGYKPGVDVAIAMDPAASELENAFREERDQPDSVGTYLFWRDKDKVVMSRDEVLELYKTAIERDKVPIVSIEDGFGERDHDGWALLTRELGDRIFIIGDDLVTTKDSNIETCASEGIMNATLIKVNQIGTITETVLAMLTSLAYRAQLVVSHRSKSPNDPFEADVSTAMNALGIKAGGGANTERLQKYARVNSIMKTASARSGGIDEHVSSLRIGSITSAEEPTNAGIPTVSATVSLGSGGALRFSGSTPLGTSAGEDEASHLTDSVIMPGALVSANSSLFKKSADGTFKFKKDVKLVEVEATENDELVALFKRAQRYSGKGCLQAAANSLELAKAFVGRKLAEIGGLADIDRELMRLEKERAIALGVISADASAEDLIKIMQRKSFQGMNAILPLSLALGRAVAASQGKELWQLIREEASTTMAKFIAANDIRTDKKPFEALMAMDFESLKSEFQDVSEQVIGRGQQIHPLLREQLPVYSI